MNGFKLLAIRPLKDCDKKYVNVLIGGQIYQLYNDCNFFNQVGAEINSTDKVDQIIFDSSLPDNLYNRKDLKINISAIVGRNGSGKSTLMDLIFVSIFRVAIQERILHNTPDDIDDSINQLLDEIVQLEDEKRAMFSNSTIDIPQVQEWIYNRWAESITEKVYKEINIKNRIDQKKGQITALTKLKNEIQIITTGLSVEIYYVISNVCFCLRIKPNKKPQIIPIKSNLSFPQADIKYNEAFRDLRIGKIVNSPLPLSDFFFYTIGLNYSHYSLNSREIGSWISELFHKNDGYQTPVVINPMRTDGIIDINIENHLVRSRLLTTLLTPIKWSSKKDLEEQLLSSPRCLIENKIARSLIIEVDRDKFYVVDETAPNSPLDLLCWKQYGHLYWEKIESKFILDENGNAPKRDSTIWDDYAKDYILGKLYTMSEKYPPYKNMFTEDTIDNYLDLLEKDTSHIAFKFKQAINFLKYNYAKVYVEGQKLISIETLSKELTRYANKEDLINLVPPAFLKVDIIFSEVNIKEQPLSYQNTFNKLSSGEKQKIYATSSITYHLLYVDSVEVKPGLPHKYRNINLVFDEVELYYHPELQRNFVNDLLVAISRLRLKHIKNLNCIFITHSPFILSDIPRENILMLELDKKTKKSKPRSAQVMTFGANLHSLLKDSFYFDKSYIGEFARIEIQKLINTLQLGKSIKGEVIDESPDDLKRRIEMIGEPFIVNKLLEKYYEKFSKEARIVKLEKELKNLRK